MHDSELQFKYWNSVLQAQVDEAKIATGGVIDIAKVRSDATLARSKKSDQGTASDKGEGTEGKSATA
jgi:hypothetical protein